MSKPLVHPAPTAKPDLAPQGLMLCGSGPQNGKSSFKQQLESDGHIAAQ